VRRSLEQAQTHAGRAGEAAAALSSPDLSIGYTRLATSLLEGLPL
jgi:hypothetical protein